MNEPTVYYYIDILSTYTKSYFESVGGFLSGQSTTQANLAVPSYGNVVEKSKHGNAKMALLTQIPMMHFHADPLVILGFKGLMIAIHLEKKQMFRNIWNSVFKSLALVCLCYIRELI